MLKNCGNSFKFYSHSNVGGKHHEKDKSAGIMEEEKGSGVLFYFYPGHKESKNSL